MKATKYIKIIFLFATGIFLILSSCKKDDEINPGNIEEIPSGILNINQFISYYMNLAYFWNKEMPDIDYKTEPDPEKYFYKLLKEPDDRWSFITDNITELENYLQGIAKSKGYSIAPYYFKEGSNQVVAFVQFVYRDSPAEQAGLKRGDMFYKINGQTITDINYQQLLSLDDVTLTMGQIIDGDIVKLDPEVNISAVENFSSHPILSTSIIEASGLKIGYLAYGSFINNFDTAIVNTFSRFHEAGVDELILDLRYNGGGHVGSAVTLASLIGSADLADETFIFERWNSNLSSFNDAVKFEEQGFNLGLNRLFVLTTDRTASASEMVIYGLEPYIDIIQVGENTYGKYYGSVIISDNNQNPHMRRHNWAIQPIVFRAENIKNNINYQQGLPPTFTIDDDMYAVHLFDEGAQLGEKEEFFIANVLSIIETGSPILSDAELKRSSLRSSKAVKLKDILSTYHGLMISERTSGDF
ncbi:S41 family peptidase [Alkalitalea saponilacus]|uniref:Peptidase family S41 n=1 Tax=Alkalitalea saponilacus TaxID=889453 RepID=A0A1T5HMQ7_9BACT|nr:S41 family peptidase [Alkalitalea saponilacus]ASB49405.1 peptidase S41 [Alkalitalea saponilacus]SKC21811.1 Peptidase family S41 [Alkalitalea saponilacus]